MDAHAKRSRLKATKTATLVSKRCGVLSCPGSGRGLGKQFDDLLVELVDDSAQRQDVEHALSVLEQVDDLFAASHEGGLAAVHDEVGCCDVLAEFVLEVGKDVADLFEANPRIEQVLDHLEFEQVAVAVLAP